MHTAFIGLDYIVDITHPDGRIPSCAAAVAERGVIAAANRALAKDWLSILVKVGFAADYADQPKRSPMFGRAHELGALRLDGPGTAFHPDLRADLADLVVVKPRVSAFYGTNLDAALRARQIEHLVIAGVSTAWAVQATVRDAHDRDYRVTLLEDACAAANPDEHAGSVALLGRIAAVLTTAEIDGL